MKNFILSLLVLTISCTTEAQTIPTTSKPQDLRESVIIETDIFTVNYSEVLEQPLWVEYTVQCPLPGADRGSMDFWEPQDVHTSDDDDYKYNVWDKGHIAPAAAFNCTSEMLRKTFNFLNCALQYDSLNRGVWNHLEEFERNLANFFEVRVRVDILFEGELEKLSSGATVPSGFRKTITFGDREIVFEFPNEDTSGTYWMDYLVTE